jgi:hypothetical protein
MDPPYCSPVLTKDEREREREREREVSENKSGVRDAVSLNL